MLQCREEVMLRAGKQIYKKKKKQSVEIGVFNIGITNLWSNNLSVHKESNHSCAFASCVFSCG